MATRLLSHSEVSSYHTCQLRHDLSYSGQILGYTLKPKIAAPILRDGRAWGALIAAWHQTDDISAAELAMQVSLDEDAQAMKDAGVFNEADYADQYRFLMDLLAQYIGSSQGCAVGADPTKAGRIPGDRPEHQIVTTIPSRTGKRMSNKYGLDVRIDMILTDAMDRDWIIEFKLRKQLMAYDLMVKQQQYRWYAWAWRQQSGRDIAGVIVDERFNGLPSAPMILKSGKVSADKGKRVDPIEYEAACIKAGHEPDPETLVAHEGRKWGQRVPLYFTKAQLEVAGKQLVSAGQQIHDADTGETYPLANANQMNCGGCPFKEICTDLGNTDYIDHYFDRTVPKHARELPLAA